MKSLFTDDMIAVTVWADPHRQHYDWLDWASHDLLGGWWYWPGSKMVDWEPTVWEKFLPEAQGETRNRGT